MKNYTLYRFNVAVVTISQEKNFPPRTFKTTQPLILYFPIHNAKSKIVMQYVSISLNFTCCMCMLHMLDSMKRMHFLCPTPCKNSIFTKIWLALHCIASHFVCIIWVPEVETNGKRSGNNILDTVKSMFLPEYKWWLVWIW